MLHHKAKKGPPRQAKYAIHCIHAIFSSKETQFAQIFEVNLKYLFLINLFYCICKPRDVVAMYIASRIKFREDIFPLSLCFIQFGLKNHSKVLDCARTENYLERKPYTTPCPCWTGPKYSNGYRNCGKLKRL